MKNVLKKIIVVFYFTVGILTIAALIYFAIVIAIDSKKQHHFELHQSEDEIASIFVADIQRRNEKNGYEYIIINNVSLDRKEELLNDIYSINYNKMKFAMEPGHPHGLCIIIKYNNDSYEIISEKYPCYCVIENEELTNRYFTIYICNSDEFDSFVSKYKENLG